MITEINVKLVIVPILNKHLSQTTRRNGLWFLVATEFFVPLSCQSLLPELYLKKKRKMRKKNKNKKSTVMGVWGRG